MKINNIYLRNIVLLSLLVLHPTAMAIDPLRSGYPSIPPAYETLSIGKQIAKASVTFGSVTELTIGETNGYTVTDPYGNTFVVDNIESPTYAFYGNYIETSDNLTVFDTPKISSTVYVETINFGN